LDTKKFSDIIRRNLTSLANNTRHNIPLEVALQAVGAEYGVPLNLNDVLDNHHYVTVPIVTVIFVIMMTIAIIFAVVIARHVAESRRHYQIMVYMNKRQDNFDETLRFREEEEEEREQLRPRKATAPQPPQERSFTEPPPYGPKGRGRPGYSESPAGRPGYPLGATLSLIEELQEHGKTTAGHSLGMNTTDLQGEGASALGGFDLGRDQVASRNYPRGGAPVAINMRDMMEQK
jgi:hypothetical protein